MEVIKEAIQFVWNYILTLKITDYIDIAIIAFLAYRVIMLLRKSKSAQVAKGIFLLMAALWLSSLLQFYVLNFLLSKTVEWGVLALVILFQPELRRLLEQVGSGKLLKFIRQEKTDAIEHAVAQTVTACTVMAKDRVGALIVFERNIRLDDVIKTGTVLDATVSSELLKSIFYPKSPLHDGAVVIRAGRVAGAGCMLPMSGNVNLSRDLGMRHRAGIGMSEASDAVVAVVSEETGSISVASAGLLRRHLAPETLYKLLSNELLVNQDEDGRKNDSFSSKFRSKKGDQADDKPH